MTVARKTSFLQSTFTHSPGLVGSAIRESVVHWILLLILLVATAARVYKLDGASLWADELWGVDACSQGTWWAMIDSMILKDSHPPGYQTMLYFWMQWFGDADSTVRLPSVLAGIASVYALFRFGARFLTPTIGLIAAALLAVSYQAIYYSQEARAYVFLILFAVWHYHLFFRLFLKTSSADNGSDQARHVWVGFWVVGLLLCYFHYVGVVIVFSEAIALVLVPAFRQKLPVVIKAFQPILILYLPWLLVMMRHVLHPDQSWETPVPGWDVLVATARFMWGPAGVQFYPTFAAFVAYMGLVFYQHRKGTLSGVDRHLLLALLLAFLPWALFFIKSHVSSSAYTVRHFIYIMPVTALVTARMIVALLAWLKLDAGVKTLAALLVAVCWVMLAFNVSDRLLIGGKLYSGITKQEYREAVAVIVRDADFMKTERKNVFISNLFFNHYLKRLRVRWKPAHFIHADAPQKIPEYADFIRKEGMVNYYYLEVFENLETRDLSPVLREWRKRYHAVCTTRFFWVQVFKFNTQLPPNPEDALKACPRSVAGQPSIQEPASG